VNIEPIESMEEFEAELRQALEKTSAPPSLKRKVLEQRGRLRTQRLRARAAMWQRLAASVALAAALGGGFAWRNREERLKGEAARAQVLTALRITAHALNQVNEELANHDSAGQE
jgi:hypothetical protein